MLSGNLFLKRTLKRTLLKMSKITNWITSQYSKSNKYTTAGQFKKKWTSIFKCVKQYEKRHPIILSKHKANTKSFVFLDIMLYRRVIVQKFIFNIVNITCDINCYLNMLLHWMSLGFTCIPKTTNLCVLVKQ